MRLVAATLVVAFLCGIRTAGACRYNVRDVGFVDLGRSTYTLRFENNTDDAAGSDGAIRLRQHFSPGNVSIAVAADEPANLAADATLVAPDGRTFALNLPNDESWTAETLHAAVVSKFSQQLVDRLIDCHSLVVLVECEDADANRAARQAIAMEIEKVAATRSMWPKPIKNLPEMVALAHADREAERLFLWSHEVDSESSEPQIVVMFGRGRALGTPISRSEMAQGKLAQYLNIISIDCECDFNVASLIGPMMPHAWTEQHEATASKSLDFDPGLPLVQIEVEQILARWPREGGDETGLPEFGDPLLGYQEIELPTIGSDDESSGTPSDLPDEPKPVEPPKTPASDVATSDNNDEDAATIAWHYVVWSIGGVVGLSLLGSLLILARRNS